jgi:hypothetical protein
MESIKLRLKDINAHGDMDTNAHFLYNCKKCVICKNVDTIKNNKISDGCVINHYNNNVRGILCNTCNAFERKVRKCIEDENYSLDELLGKFDKKKIENTIFNLYKQHGITPMLWEYYEA